MRKLTFLTLISFALMMIACNPKPAEEAGIKYPETLKGDVVDTYFGVDVADPYRWLENDTTKETGAWVDSQNLVTFDYLDKIPFRANVKKRLEGLWNYPKYGLPYKKGEFWYFSKNDGLQAQSVTYQMDSPEGEPRTFIDPNTFSEDGTVALSGMSFSQDGKYCAYKISRGGSDWNEAYVLNTETKELLEDKIQWIKFSGLAWHGDGFYYSRYEEPKEGDALKGVNENNRVYFHKVGTAQDEDMLIYEDPTHPMRSFGIGLTEDESIMTLYANDPDGRGNAISYKMADAQEWTVLEESFDFNISIVDNMGTTLYIRSNKNASRYKLLAIDLADATAEVKEILPEHKMDVLEGVSVANNKLLAYYMHDATNKAFVYNPDGTLKHEVKFPEGFVGTISGFTSQRDSKDAFVSLSSFVFPNMAFKYDLESNEMTSYRESEIDFDISAYETKQVFYESKDGTKIPMFITHKKGIELNGDNPTLLYGYGGFNISLTPSFSISNLVLLENGGVYAMPNLRGGGEYGEEWHQAGTQLNKQNVFDDFIAAAEYLIKEGYTSSAKLAIRGGSNGGLLVGACMTQRPNLFKVAFPAVGVMDMLRYHNFTIGRYWAPDYGTSDNEEQFHYLLAYSPLHTIKEGTCYPATMVTTADHDDRVVPAHSFKFAAELQAKQSCNAPTLIRIQKDAGHGAGRSTDVVISEAADIWSFMFYNMGLEMKY